MSEDDRRLFVAHHHPGRLRVRARAFEHDATLREGVRSWLVEQRAVLAARAHARTGGVLVVYDPERVDAGTLLEGIVARAHLELSEPEPSPPPARAVLDAASALDARVLAWTDGRFDLRSAVPAALFVGSIASLAFSDHKLAPRWDNLLYWSVHFLRTLNLRDGRDDA